jgi:hyperosmotically inducible protein
MQEGKMERKLHTPFIVALAAVSLMTLGAAENNTPSAAEQGIQKEVRHELLMLPYYNVFDNLEFAVNGHTVTLMGQVTWPALKSDAENVVKKIKGVNKVINDIQVLPPSPMDDRIRMAELLHIYSAPGFEKYAIQPVPSIHIIVDNGRVTLEGVVDSKADKDIAGMRANTVPGTFEVTNNLRVERG